mgnify:CR=1 FL=1
MQLPTIYEKKTYDIDFPIQLFYEHRNQNALYYGPHWHEEIEFNYVTRGSSVVTLEQQEYTLTEGSLLIINSNTLHSAHCTSVPYTCKVIAFCPENLLERFSIQNFLFHPFIENDPQIDYYMEQIFKECEEQQIAYKANCKSYITQLLVYLCRNYMSDILSDRMSEQRKSRLLRLNPVLLYIDEHFTEPISNRQLADIMYLNEDHFCHLFSQSLGISPQKYIAHLRLDKAQELILAKEHTITEIAQMVGYQDYNHFGRQFRRRFNCTPQEMSKQHVRAKEI